MKAVCFFGSLFLWFNFWLLVRKQRIKMKNHVKNAFLFFFFLADILLFVSCDKGKSTKTTFPNQNKIITNTDDAINCDSSLINNKDSINIVEYNGVSAIHKDNLRNSDQSNENINIISSVDSMISPTISNDNYMILDEINSLIVLLNYYESQDFSDCTTVEKSVNEFTQGFFLVIEKIDINDTISIAELRKLEHFGLMDKFQADK